MTKRQRQLLNKNCTRDALTGRRIGAYKEVIEVKNAVEWCKKQGYRVSIQTKDFRIPFITDFGAEIIQVSGEISKNILEVAQ